MTGCSPVSLMVRPHNAQTILPSAFFLPLSLLSFDRRGLRFRERGIL
jgi:hypothetical protein